jgi:hypothetical protein
VTRLLDQIQRAVRRLVGHVDHVDQAGTRIRDLVRRDVLQPRLDAEALERLLQVAGELAQLLEHPRLAHVHDVVNSREEPGLILRPQRLGEGFDAGAVFQLQYCKTRHVTNSYLPAPRILSSFSLRVSAVKGLIT